MGGRRTTKEELAQLEALTKEGLTARDIAQKLGRSPAAIRNLRYKKHLFARAEDETKALFQQRDDLRSMLKTLQGQKTTLAYEVDSLKKEKQKLEAIINVDRTLLERALAQGLVNLKQQRPELFYMSDQEQKVRLLGLFLKNILA
jgi:IS30 family transposase